MNKKTKGKQLKMDLIMKDESVYYNGMGEPLPWEKNRAKMKETG